MRVRVKICGVRSTEAIRAAVDAGADALGLVFAISPRQVEIPEARALADEIPAFVSTVGVFRYPSVEEVDAVLAQVPLDLVQTEPGRGILGKVPGPRLLPVFHDSDDLIERANRFREAYGFHRPLLLEGPGRGGQGVRPNWMRATALARVGRLVLAGGLDPDNVADAVERVRPYGVDVSSGVEEGGRKDAGRIRAFVQAVRAAENASSP
ncbi:MAG: phosphoribosylanthranilate isomerase [Gemmatimonadota bacterium]